MPKFKVEYEIEYPSEERLINWHISSQAEHVKITEVKPKFKPGWYRERFTWGSNNLGPWMYWLTALTEDGRATFVHYVSIDGGAVCTTDDEKPFTSEPGKWERVDFGA